MKQSYKVELLDKAKKEKYYPIKLYYRTEKKQSLIRPS